MRPCCLTLVAHLAVLVAPALAQDRTLRLAVTTSFENSGLAEVLLPAIQADTGIDVQLLVVGTGQAIELGERGDVDAVLVHSEAAETAFVDSGHGTERTEIMSNDFVVVGPASDPAGIAEAKDAAGALQAIADAKAPFVSRGDDSGTHQGELALWTAAGANPESFDPAWYREAGAGMGATLNIAAGLDAYALADRGSWLAFENKGDLKILFEGDAALRNQYAFIPVNPERHPHVNFEAAIAVRDWLTGDRGQGTIADFRIGGEPAFVPNAKRTGARLDPRLRIESGAFLPSQAVSSWVSSVDENVLRV